MSSDKVTLRDIYDLLDRLETKIDKRVEKIETDIEDIRAFQNKALGILGIAATFISLSATYVWNKVIGVE